MITKYSFYCMNYPFKWKTVQLFKAHLQTSAFNPLPLFLNERTRSVWTAPKASGWFYSCSSCKTAARFPSKCTVKKRNKKFTVLTPPPHPTHTHTCSCTVAHGQEKTAIDPLRPQIQNSVQKNIPCVSRMITVPLGAHLNLPRWSRWSTVPCPMWKSLTARCRKKRSVWVLGLLCLAEVHNYVSFTAPLWQPVF